MAKTYKAIAGPIQFDPNEREALGQTVRDIVIKPVGAAIDGNVRVTLWPEYAGVQLSKGMFVSVEGKFTVSSNKGTTYYNMDATDLWILGEPVSKKERGVVDEVQEDVSDDKAPF